MPSSRQPPSSPLRPAAATPSPGRHDQSATSCRSRRAARPTSIGRTLAQGLAPVLGQPVVVDNKPGAAGAVGAGFVAKAKPDGYTLLGGTISTHAINASLYKDLPYDPVKDFEPITLVGFIPNALYVNPNLGVNSVADLIALLKKDANKRTFASSGAGTSTHLAGELFADLIGVQLTHVPYKGTPQAFADVVGGQVTFMFDQLTAGLPLVKGGKLKLLAVTTAKRAALSPETPTMAEAGVAKFEMVSWQAVYAPKGTPEADRRSPQRRDREDPADAGSPRQDGKPDGHRDRRVLAGAAHRADAERDSALGGPREEVRRDAELGEDSSHGRLAPPRSTACATSASRRCARSCSSAASATSTSRASRA